MVFYVRWMYWVAVGVFRKAPTETGMHDDGSNEDKIYEIPFCSERGSVYGSLCNKIGTSFFCCIFLINKKT